MELSRTKILFHDTGGLFKNCDAVYQQICKYANRLAQQGKERRNTMAIWLGCGMFLEWHNSNNCNRAY